MNPVPAPAVVKPMPFDRYVPTRPLQLADRTWPTRWLESAPTWCSVDLRDGNQALIDPMDPARKRRMFDVLVGMGFKEIEVGFPAASQPDFDFIRTLVADDLVPDDVTIQVLTQCREDQIERTFQSITGARRAIVHVYNSTSTVQRRVVFQADQAETIALAVDALRWCRKFEARIPETQVRYEYSPESFTGTEPEFAVEICERVMDVVEPTVDQPMIVNLPSTVELYMPNVYADVIEWFGRSVRNRDCITLSVHPHNDRGTAVAAAELAVLAGADRVEGTLFGNGERTGNVDVITLAMNLFSHGVDPGLDLSDIDSLRATAEWCNRLPVHPRHPYAGDLVYTAFSGSHQDAIKKGLHAIFDGSEDYRTWDVPYLPIDPAHVGRTYEAVIRVNSQSGKGGVAYVMDAEHGMELPRGLQIEFSKAIQSVAEGTGTEIGPEEMWARFEELYLPADHRVAVSQHEIAVSGAETRLRAVIEVDGVRFDVASVGSGPIDCYVTAVREITGVELDVVGYVEHARGEGARAEAVAYVACRVGGQAASADLTSRTDVPEAWSRRRSGGVVWGVGINTNVVTAGFEAVSRAVERLSDVLQQRS